MALHLFNPENDLALACFEPHYIPPQSARTMAADLSTLPAWWAEEGDAVCVDSVTDARRMAEESHGLCPAVEWVVEAGDTDFGRPEPWGWSPLAVTRLRRAGCPEERLPDEGRLRLYRDLSGRRHAVDMVDWLRSAGSELGRAWGYRLCGAARYCTDEESVVRLLSACPDSLLKAPWSGSGKGLRLGHGGYVPPLSGWCRRLLREQGGVVVEPIYNKVCDFALEYEADGQGDVTYKGLSLFENNSLLSYAANRVAAEEVKLQRLLRFIPLAMWEALRASAEAFLRKRFATAYCGSLGVDMMLCRPEGGTESDAYLLHPCVEVNLRRTMGHCAVSLGRLLASGVEARFAVDYFKDSAALMADHERLRRECPLHIEDSCLYSGYLPLTPVTPRTHYRALLLAGALP